MSIPDQRPRDILSMAAAFRAAVIAQEDVAVQELVNAYILILDRLESDLDDLLRRIEVEREAGRDITRAWLARQERLQALVDQVEREVAIVAANMEASITTGQRNLVLMGQSHAQQLMLAGLGPAPAGVTMTFNRLNARAVEQMAGFLANGSPLRDLLGELGPDASQAVREALLRGIGTGQNPRTVARLMREALDGNLARAERIARTEQLRAYRQASHETYKANRDVVSGWIWTAALDERTCMSCALMHGTLHDVDEVFGSHPNCRCAMVPRTRSWEELGFTGIDDTRPDIETGEEWFNKLDEFTRRKMLGKSKYAAYKAGEFDLAELVGFKNDPTWGPQRYEKSLKAILGSKQAREFYQAAD